MKTPNKLLFSLLFTIFAIHIQAHDLTKKLISQITGTDPFEFLDIELNPDGSLTRNRNPTVPPNTTSSLAFSKDVLLNPEKKTWVRIHIPNRPESELVNLPIILFIHGGGFIMGSAIAPDVDLFLANAVNQLNVLVVSVEYRLAPEHRLPAAYDDATEALFWVKENNDEWVKKYGDVTKCIIMGESAGGNIAYTLGIRASYLVDQLGPMVIKGLVLMQPFFGQVSRTETELYANGGLPLEVTDLMWNFSLPIGTNRNHPYSNPSIGTFSKWEKIKELDWKVAFAACDGDGLFDKEVEVYNLMKNYGVNVLSSFGEGGYHGIYIQEMDQSQKVFELVKSILSSHMSY
ncbi:unnamed protein product [Amaranthus hypochondriacus]